MELVALSHALKVTILLMRIVNKLQKHGHPFIYKKPHIYCRVFEDNQGAIEMATVPKI